MQETQQFRGNQRIIFDDLGDLANPQRTDDLEDDVLKPWFHIASEISGAPEMEGEGCCCSLCLVGTHCQSAGRRPAAEGTLG